MTSFEKVVKLACKPKAAPPKAKYLDPIIAATWSEDGAVHDVCKALSPRFREPNVIVVFKALIVLHTMIRNGSTDNVLQYLSSSDVLKLKNVSAGNWEGYNAPQNLQHYAIYLDSRIRAYRDLKHDAIRVQSETNRDMRNSQAIEESGIVSTSTRKRGKTTPAPAAKPQRSHTIAGRKLRIMTVEKGLLRETKIAQRMIDALLDCRFYLDDLDDELNITALRMLVKDLLILFQACNEGVINVLEHYFEMSHVDAEEALAIYRHFCKETERVVEYLGVAKKLQNLLNVPIPNLRHAPVSLAGALEEYLNDPNFEQNRIEYKTSKEAADRNTKLGVKALARPLSKSPSPKPAETSVAAAATSSPGTPAKSPGGQAMIDFFSAIEGEQQSMFNPQTNSPTSNYFQQHATHNPFMPQQMTGAPNAFDAQAFAPPQMQMQPTGFMMQQQTGFQQPSSTNPFGMQQQQQQPFQPFLQPQHTTFLQPQATGANPFRQSTLFPQATGMSPFGMGMGVPQQPQPASTNPFPMQSTGMPQGPGTGQQQTGTPAAHPAFNQFTSIAGSSNSSFPSVVAPSPTTQASSVANFSALQRSSSVPLTNFSSQSASSSEPEPVKTHQTGSRNPFGVPVTAVPQVPKPPTLLELAMGGGSSSQSNGTQGAQQQSQPTGAPGSNFGLNGFGNQLSSQPTGSAMSNVASSFSFSQSNGTQSGGMSPSSAQPTSSGGSAFSDSHFSSLSTQPTGASPPSISVSPAPLKPQTTGFGGIKAFKPSSSFGAALLESLPTIPQSEPGTPSESPKPPLTSPLNMNDSHSTSSNPALGNGLTGLSAQRTGMPFGGINSQPTGSMGGFGSSNGSTVGVGLRPQMTGGVGGANPFRASMFSMAPSATGGAFGAGAGGSGQPSFLSSSSTPAFGGSPFGTGASAFGLGQDASKPQPQQNGSASLI